MSFMTSIIDALDSVSDWFYKLYLEVYGWVYPFWLTADFFYQLSVLFNTLAWRFYDFSLWVSEVQGKVSLVLSWSTIWSSVLGMVPNLLQLRDWFYNWVTFVTNTVNTWWGATSLTVQAWVQSAKDMATSLFNQLNNALASLQSAWDSFKGKVPTIDAVISWWGNWWGNVLPQLGTWWNSRLLEVQGLIDSAFLTRQSLWSGWQEMRENVVEFFADPVELIWNRFTNWFLGPEV